MYYVVIYGYNLHENGNFHVLFVFVVYDMLFVLPRQIGITQRAMTLFIVYVICFYCAFGVLFV